MSGDDRNRVVLVTGGARSGKSRYAEELALQYGGKRVYVATAEPFDEEMQQRIALHQKSREGRFSRTVEEPINLDHALQGIGRQASVVLVDCVTVWLGNLIHHRGMLDRYDEIDRLLSYLERPMAPTIIVTNEVGQGIVPGDPMSRFFRDQAGWLNQALARAAHTVVWMVSGIPVSIKEEGRAE